MTFVSVLALAVALSLDSLGVGVAYGLRRIRVPWSLYVIVGLCTGTLMALSMGLGSHLSGYLSPLVARRTGGLVLVGVGLWQLYQGWQTYRQRLGAPEGDDAGKPHQVLKLDLRALGLVVQILVEPAAADVDRSGQIDSKEAIALGLALGLDSLGAGFGAALAGYGGAVIPVVAVMCGLFVWFGLVAARSALSGLSRKANLLPGFLLVTLGLLRL